MPEQHDLVEDLVYECLERFAADGQAAVDELLAQHDEAVQHQVRETMSVLQRVGLAGDAPVDGGAPEQLGSYRLHERLGSGAMGVVYRASRIDGGDDDLAIKLMQPGLLPMRGSRLRFPGCRLYPDRFRRGHGIQVGSYWA